MVLFTIMPIRISPGYVALIRTFRRILLLALLACVIWLVVAFQLFVAVEDEVPLRTDAVVVLGGASAERLPVALRLRAALNDPVLVLSHTRTPGNSDADALCRDQPKNPDDRILCVTLDRQNTRGEARAIGRLAASKGWTTITVVTSRYHMTRAETLVRQCTAAQIASVGSTPHLNLKEWLFRFVEETGGLMDAMARPECRS